MEQRLEKQYGFHRVMLENATPQSAETLISEPSLLDASELLIDVEILQLDSTSARQLTIAHGDSVASAVREIVRTRGKMHNPVTDSGGVLVGRVRQCGPDRQPPLAPGTRVVPLCSMTAIPLRLESVEPRLGPHGMVYVRGVAVVFGAVRIAVVPDDLPVTTFLGAVDVSRLVPHVQKSVASMAPKSVAVLGCGRGGLLALAMCGQLCPDALLIGLDVSFDNLCVARALSLPNRLYVEQVDVTNARAVLRSVCKATNGNSGVDLVLNFVNAPNTEAGTSLVCRSGGRIVYFSMATDFCRATLSTDIVGNPLDEICIAAGVFDQAPLDACAMMRSNPVLRRVFTPPERHHPLHGAIPNSAMAQFARHVGLPEKCSYRQLHAWSVSCNDQFWNAFMDYSGLRGASSSADGASPAPVGPALIKTGSLFNHCQWFPGVQLNHAQILLRHADRLANKVALRGLDESLVPRDITYGQLAHQVTLLQRQLKALGVRKGSVVGAVMSNVPEAVVAMLATTSLGAVWCCLSLDLGPAIVLSRLSQVAPMALFVQRSYRWAGKLHDRTDMLCTVTSELQPRHAIEVASPGVATRTLSPDQLGGVTLHQWADLMSQQQPSSTDAATQPEFTPCLFSEPVFVLFTSGTTGRPKCIAQGLGECLPRAKLASCSGGTELNGCLALCNPLSPVWGSELQGAPLGMDVDVIEIANNGGCRRVMEQQGELACFNPFPSMPLFFWGDLNGERYHRSYFDRVPGVWVHGDWAVRSAVTGDFEIMGRSDTTLNPGGIRMGTLDYYSVVESIDGVADSIVVSVPVKGAEKIALFIVLHDRTARLPDQLRQTIRQTIRKKLSPHHVPFYIVPVDAVPVNLNNKKMETLVRSICAGKVDQSSAVQAAPLANPDSLKQYFEWAKREIGGPSAKL